MRQFINMVQKLNEAKKTFEKMFDELDKWITSNTRGNRYFYANGVDVYIRLGRRMIEDRIIPSLEIGNISDHGHKTNKCFLLMVLRFLEQYSGYVVYVEQTLNPEVEKIMPLLGYKKVPREGEISFYKIIT